ncbi:MAG: nucleotidyltransferase domain-containing protein [bacterium]
MKNNSRKIKKHESFKRLGDNHIVLLYLFGSVARGTSHKESDVDMGILFDKKTKESQYLRLESRIIEFFSKMYSQKEINVVNFNISSPLLKQSAILEGKLLYKRSDEDRIFFEINTLREYEEYSHLSKIYNQFLNVKLENL